MRMPKVDHVGVGPHNRLQCLRCGAHEVLGDMVELGELGEKAAAFAKAHRRCPMPDQPRCGICLELGHAGEEHVALKVTRYEDWLTSGDTGRSSETIWRHMMGQSPPHGGPRPPEDPDDFGRCHRLLAKFPEWRPRIGEMARYPRWALLVDAWVELEALYVEERPTGEGPKLYHRMKVLLGEVRS